MEPTSGSMEGGTLLTITGKFFGNNKENVKVTVAGSPCMVQSVTSERITCITTPVAQENLQGDLFPGYFFLDFI